MRALLLCSRPPWPLHGGDRIRTWHLARALSTLGDVSVVATRSPAEDPAAIRAGLPFVSSLRLPVLDRHRAALRAATALPSPRPLQQALYDSAEARRATAEALSEGVDVVLAHLVRTVPWLPDDGPPVVVDVQDALSLQYAAAGGRGHGWRRAAMALERPRIGRAEAAAIHRSSAVTFISPRDRDAVAPNSDRPTAILPAVVDLERFAPGGPPEAGRIGFVGQLRTAANRDMAVHFARRVLPLIRSARRDARFAVVGRGGDRSVARLGRLPGVEVVGPVDDVVAELRRFAVTVCPQRFGSGVQNKVLQSLAAGTPAVVTPAVAESLPDADGLVVGRLDRAFAMQTLELLNDGARRDALGQAGRAWVAAHHAPSALEEALRSLLTELGLSPR